MKKMKKLLTMLLTLAMLATGLYFVKADGNEAKAETATGAAAATGAAPAATSST